MYNEPMLRENALLGKCIIITGGGTGLGKSIAKYCGELGAHVIIASRKADVLEATANELHEKTQAQYLPVVCDVRNYEEVDALLRKSIEKFGRVDALLNNAAGNFVMPTERLSHRAFDAVIDIVLRGTCNCSLALGKYWIENKLPGVILNVVTTYAFTGSAYVVPSAAAKGGVLALTRSLAAEWGRKNIRVNAIAPGPFPTEGAWSRLFPPVVQEAVDPVKRIPVGRFGDHQELANLAAYLLSDFSAYVNGEVMVIDGGEWVHGAGQFTGLEAVPDELWDMWEKMRKK
ncbi:MAG: SDR family oxidoreductase [Chitinophagales bacterium]|nr:SDR family oxidoreductase [Chitinophagales bacterium]